MYDKTTIHTIIFILCILGYLVSPKMDIQEPIPTVHADNSIQETEKAQSGMVQTVQVGGKEDSKKTKSVLNETDGPSKRESNVESVQMKKGPSDSTGLCNLECKLQNLKDIGIRDEIAEALIFNCKALAEDPVNCIKIGAFLVQNESSGGKNCKKSNEYNCFGLSVKENYQSYDDATMHWVGKYNKFWYKQRTPDSFYSNSPDWKPKTYYCLSEVQPNGTKLSYCPNGHKNAWSVYNKLKF